MKKTTIYTVMALFALSLPVFSANIPGASNLEVGGGYEHVSGYLGLNGFDVDAAAIFSRRVAIAFDYDGVYDTSTVLQTSTGQIVSKSHLQDFLIGPRVYFPGLFKGKNKTISLLHPFAEIQLGDGYLRQSSTNTLFGPSHISTSDNAFAWLLGGAVDYRLSPHWVGRMKVDLLRTHFNSEGQSHLRFVLGVAYNIKPRQF